MPGYRQKGGDNSGPSPPASPLAPSPASSPLPPCSVFQLRPACQQVYNLFHPADPSASRLEPLLERRFHALPPFSIPRYQRYPLGDGCSALLVEAVQRNPELLLEGGPPAPLPHGDGFLETSIPVPAPTGQDGPRQSPGCAESDVLQAHSAVFQENATPSSPGTAPASRGFRRASEISITSQVSGLAESYTASSAAQKAPVLLSHTPSVRRLSQLALPPPAPSTPGPRSQARQPSPSLQRAPCLPDLDIGEVAARWWGQKRIDYALYCPDALTAFPTVALPHLFHASYWESTDVVSFLLRQVMRHDNSGILELDGKEVSVFTPSKPREKWQRRRTHVKLRNVTANHRINDALANEDGPQVLTGRFMYGPLDMVTLTGEKVDVHIMPQPPSGEWLHLDTLVTNGSGRVSYTIPETQRLGVGVYPVKMVVRFPRPEITLQGGNPF
ncbi:membrane-associated phosphatidylinositol transfer protein 2-like [Dasypus novemcinctus]|uniref:membrane-associated phosphatidylinositol transfer protein 2-like n=1 Tax=Dasypus novemcinctus TaxID=9361 RepID=UPI0039C91F0C